MGEMTWTPQGLLITRQDAKQYRNRLINLLEEHEQVVINLSALELLTPSFADEWLGVLSQRYGKDLFRQRIRFVGASEELKHLISVVLANRLKDNPGSSCTPHDAEPG